MAKISKYLPKLLSQCEIDPFKPHMEYNIREAHKMYHKDDPKKLFRLLIARFIKEASRRNHEPILVVMPQLLDLTVSSYQPPYHLFFQELSKDIRVIDLSLDFKNAQFAELYVNDKYGGHLSRKGNEYAAKLIGRKLLETRINID